MAEDNKTAKNYVFTKQATNEETLNWTAYLNGAAIFQDPFRWHEDRRIKYVVYQIERAPTTGQLHVQGLVCFKQSVRLTGAKNAIGGNPHMEKCHSTKDAIRYCKKEETRVAGPWEHGDPPVNQGKRNDLAEIYADVKAQKRLADMVDADPTITKYERHIKMMKMVTGGRQSNRINQQVKVYVFYGGTGLGKTYSALFLMDDPDNVFKMDPPGKNQQLWFDCYDGERVMVFDEFEGDNFCDMRTLNGLLDVYKKRLPVKGTFNWALWTTLIICSNTPPRGWYEVNPMDSERLIGPLKRRIYQIRKFIARGIYVIEDWDGNVLSDQIDINPQPVALPSPPAPVPVPVIPSPLPVPDDEPQLLVGDLTGDQLPSMPDNSDYSSFDDTLDSVFQFNEDE